MTETVTYMLPYSIPSTVPHLLWEQGVGGSNPLTPTLHLSDGSPRFMTGALCLYS